MLMTSFFSKNIETDDDNDVTPEPPSILNQLSHLPLQPTPHTQADGDNEPSNDDVISELSKHPSLPSFSIFNQQRHSIESEVSSSNRHFV